jgi:hypothetical protein
VVAVATFVEAVLRFDLNFLVRLLRFILSGTGVRSKGSSRAINVGLARNFAFHRGSKVSRSRFVMGGFSLLKMRLSSSKKGGK